MPARPRMSPFFIVYLLFIRLKAGLIHIYCPIRHS